MLKTQIRQTEAQKQKLKKAMLDFDGIKLLTVNQQAINTSSSNFTSNYKN